jgi:hypothetical protein
MKKSELYVSPVQFHNDGHTYDLNGQKLEGVTPIIAWLFPETYKGIPQSILDKAAEYGTTIHMKCEMYDNLGIVDDPIVQSYVDLCQQKGLSIIASEYLVSDEQRVASSIDKLTEDLDIADIKTTSKVHIPLVTLQTSIYAWLFERQNEGKQVRNLYCIWLPKPQYGEPDIIQLQRVPANICEQIVDLYFQNAQPIQARALLAACGFDFEEKKHHGDIPEGVQTMMDELRMVKNGLDELKKREDELKSAIFEVMKAEGHKTWGTDEIEFTVKKAYTTTSVDSTKLKAEYPEVWEACKKERNVSESITYKVL